MALGLPGGGGDGGVMEENEVIDSGFSFEGACRKLGVDLENCGEVISECSSLLEGRYGFLVGEEGAKELWGIAGVGGEQDLEVDENEESQIGEEEGRDRYYRYGGADWEYDEEEMNNEMSQYLGKYDRDTIRRVVSYYGGYISQNQNVREYCLEVLRRGYNESAYVSEKSDRFIDLMIMGRGDSEVFDALRQHVGEKKLRSELICRKLLQDGCKEEWVLDSLAELYEFGIEFVRFALGHGVRVGECLVRYKGNSMQLGEGVDGNNAEEIFAVLEFLITYGDSRKEASFQANYLVDDYLISVVGCAGVKENFLRLNDEGKLGLLVLMVQNPQYLREFSNVLEGSAFGEVIDDLIKELKGRFGKEEWIEGKGVLVGDVARRIDLGGEDDEEAEAIFNLLEKRYDQRVSGVGVKIWGGGSGVDGEEADGRGENNMISEEQFRWRMSLLNNIEGQIKDSVAVGIINSLVGELDREEVMERFVGLMDLNFAKREWPRTEGALFLGVAHYVSDTDVVALQKLRECVERGDRLADLVCIKLFDQGRRCDWVMARLMQTAKMGVEEATTWCYPVFAWDKSVDEVFDLLGIDRERDDFEEFKSRIIKRVVREIILNRGDIAWFLELNVDLFVANQGLMGRLVDDDFTSLDGLVYLAGMIQDPEWVDYFIDCLSRNRVDDGATSSGMERFYNLLWMVKAYYCKLKILGGDDASWEDELEDVMYWDKYIDGE